MIRQTHTFAVLEISRGAFDEIAAKLRAAGYDHAFDDEGRIDMHGIAISVEPQSPSTNVTGLPWMYRAAELTDGAVEVDPSPHR